MSVITICAEREPVVAGVNETWTVQLAPVASVAPQVFVCANSEAFAPEIPMLLSVNAAFPVLLRVTGIAALVV